MTTIRICDVNGCQENAVNLGAEEHFVDALYFSDLLPGVRYLWGRVAVVNADLCKKHGREALDNLAMAIMKHESPMTNPESKPTPSTPNYSHLSHTHCWDQEQSSPACGIPLANHKQCCLCDLTIPSKPEVVEEHEHKFKLYDGPVEVCTGCFQAFKDGDDHFTVEDTGNLYDNVNKRRGIK